MMSSLFGSVNCRKKGGREKSENIVSRDCNEECKLAASDLSHEGSRQEGKVVLINPASAGSVGGCVRDYARMTGTCLKLSKDL